MPSFASQLDGIPVVNTTAERAGKFPSPSTNQRVHNLETGNIERWTGSAWTSTPLATSDPLTVGTLAVTGSTDLGDATMDTLTVTARVDSPFVPTPTATHDLGATANRWGTAWVTDIVVTDDVTCNGIDAIGSGFVASSSASAKVTIGAGTTMAAPLRISHGVAPTSPVDGDIWTTSAGLYVRINGVTVGPLS